MVLQALLDRFDKILNRYGSKDFDAIKAAPEEISQAEDVQSIRKEFAEFMDSGRASLESVVKSCLQEKRDVYLSDGIGIDEEPYKEAEIICKNHHNPLFLAKGLFPKNVSLSDIEFKKSNLIYSPAYKEEIKKGKVLCGKCGKPGEIGEVLTTIILRQKVDKIEARRRIVSQAFKIMKENYGEKGTENDFRQNVINPRLEKLGFGNLYDALEATKAFAVGLEHLFGVKYANVLKGAVSVHVPAPIMSITYSEKDNSSLADKYIIMKFGEEKRYLHDLCRVRFVPYGDIKSCYEIVDILKKKERQGMIKIEGSEEKNKENGYRAIHVDINPYNTGLICEVQIRTNEMDTLAEIDEKQAHHLLRAERIEGVASLIKENRVSEKDVYLIRLILDPQSIRAHRKGERK